MIIFFYFFTNYFLRFGIFHAHQADLVLGGAVEVDLVLTASGDWLTACNLYSANERNEFPLVGAHFF